MKTLFRLVNGLYGVGMILFGVLLAQQPILQISQTAGSDAFILIQIHFALTGFSSCWALLTPDRGGVLVRMSLLLLGFNGWIAYLAISIFRCRTILGDLLHFRIRYTVCIFAPH